MFDTRYNENSCMAPPGRQCSSVHLASCSCWPFSSCQLAQSVCESVSYFVKGLTAAKSLNWIIQQPRQWHRNLLIGLLHVVVVGVSVSVIKVHAQLPVSKIITVCYLHRLCEILVSRQSFLKHLVNNDSEYGKLCTSIQLYTVYHH